MMQKIPGGRDMAHACVRGMSVVACCLRYQSMHIREDVEKAINGDCQ